MAVNHANNVSAICEDEEMMLYKKCALNAITFRIVYEKNDLQSAHKKTSSFKPDMAHQIFGETEMIFGYKQLTIDLYYLHNSAKCYVDVQWSTKIAECDLYKPDDIMKSLDPWLPMNYRVEKDEFIKDIDVEDHTMIHGEVIQSFGDDQENKYKVTLCDTKNVEFKNFHQNFETLIIWFIDGANLIDLEDERWTIFYVYEHHVDPVTKKTYHSPIGFCTVYKFFLYPNSVRPRISQFFVLPTHQKKGVGMKLYSVIYDYLRGLPDSGDITVEEPTPVFQKIRDFCDSLHIYKDLEQNQISISTQNQKKINEYMKKHKFCKRQAQRIFDILECMISHKNGYKEYVKFTENIKSRIASDIERETRGSKRICNLERSGIVSTDHIDTKALVDAEYNKYVDSLEWPVNRLRAYLSKNSTQ